MIERLKLFSFGEPWWLLLLALVPAVAWLQGQAGGLPALSYSATSLVREISSPIRQHRGRFQQGLFLLALLLAIMAMARPRLEFGMSNDRRSGVDIVFCVDVSGSMDAKDFIHEGRPISKREALVMAISEFVDKRPNDRFGMIGFARNTYLMSPMTIDGNWIKSVLAEIQTQFQTAIGEGILSSLKLLEKSPGKSRVMIVVSDGANNHGIDPVKAAEAARASGIRVHTVQIMSPKEVSLMNVKGAMSQVASKTGGLYFQAASLDGLLDIYRQIDGMEKNEFEQKRFRIYEELFPWFVLSSFTLLTLGWIGKNTVWLRIP